MQLRHLPQPCQLPTLQVAHMHTPIQVTINLYPFIAISTKLLPFNNKEDFTPTEGAESATLSCKESAKPCLAAWSTQVQGKALLNTEARDAQVASELLAKVNVLCHEVEKEHLQRHSQ